jgi:hypothetical protein
LKGSGLGSIHNRAEGLRGDEIQLSPPIMALKANQIREASYSRKKQAEHGPEWQNGAWLEVRGLARWATDAWRGGGPSQSLRALHGRESAMDIGRSEGGATSLHRTQTIDFGVASLQDRTQLAPPISDQVLQFSLATQTNPPSQ